MTDQQPRPSRAEPREVLELRQLKTAHPELAAAVDMQLELSDAQRRVQARIPLPRIHHDAGSLAARLRDGHPAVRFDDIPLDWSDFRLSLRKTAEVLRRHDAMDPAEYQQVLDLTREGDAIEGLVRGWYEATSRANAVDVAHAPPPAASGGFDQLFALAIRPFLARCAEALLPRPEFSSWNRGYCPICGWEPDFAVITPSAERHLVCGRCTGQWLFDPLQCPYCGNNERARVTSFATRDGLYRVYGCDVCRRYLKAYDARRAARPMMVLVDSIATLPLDAAAMQRGYTA